MNLKENLPKYAVLAVLVAGMLVISYQFIRTQHPGMSPSIQVQLPQLSSTATKGEQAFNANCLQCHGRNASGTEKGPPLIHDIYNPGHHADLSFSFAVKRGVRQHHWPYGDMPAQPQVSDDQIAAIVKYVRELQIANGIKTRPHRM